MPPAKAQWDRGRASKWRILTRRRRGAGQKKALWRLRARCETRPVQEHRRYTRVAATWPVTVRTGDRLLHLQTVNLSAHGVKVSLDEPLRREPLEVGTTRASADGAARRAAGGRRGDRLAHRRRRARVLLHRPARDRVADSRRHPLPHEETRWAQKPGSRSSASRCPARPSRWATTSPASGRQPALPVGPRADPRRGPAARPRQGRAGHLHRGRLQGGARGRHQPAGLGAHGCWAASTR